MPFRILHIDDDSDIREIVALSLSLDSALTVRSCLDGADALTTAAEWAPDLILCDVMMPGMDGPTMLARLRENPGTARIPVVFMTARSGSNELEHLMSIGAAAVFTKPFDPMLLAGMVQTQLRSVRSETVRYDFAARLHSDAAELARYRKILWDHPDSVLLPTGFQSCVHKLSGAAGVFNFQAVSRKASALEAAIVEWCAGRGAAGTVEANLDALLGCIECESMRGPSAVNR
jgi:two-component system OmpR family response regulator